ncbi:pyridoxal phosphate-dependent decarboxylase family protein [Ancylomarina longa]|uniref:Aminotransferase class V-fold PLP-dependent enzyme n=1 Tax=Ancylomarina longa TaxID=2487017 RepID=A0A434AXX5_9BACT|nr:pyridoxal-dependent decarboxylase [Ancylomarina longa]RUT79405.1 aminotransferase class V-fold PLP-dependent enzyme [Ancylomarina longa]
MKESDILSEALVKIKNYIAANKDQDAPIVKFRTPADLDKIIHFTVDTAGVSENEFLDLLDKYLEYSVHTGNKQFLNQLYSGFNFPAFIGEIFSTLANTSMYTYEVAPVATSIEKEMIALMNSYTGYSDGDGIFVTGGSNANLIAMFSARNRILPDSRFEGYDRKVKLKAFVNEQAHYSFDTAANVLGIGSKNVVKVKSDVTGKMIPAELEKNILETIARNEKPFFVAATCATTLLGAYDPLDEIAAICKKYKLWLHADGSFGGSLILSDQYKALMKGIERTDSFAWNPHKLMNIPLICSALLVKKRGTLQHNITDINADYIFHDIDEIEDLGKKSIQCGRKVDAVKLWFAWKYFGLKNYQKRIDNLINMAIYAAKKISDHPQLEMLVPRQSFAVCFRYVPKFKTDLNQFNLDLREQLRKSGKSIVNYGYIRKSLAIRLVITNGELLEADMDLFFKNLLDAANNLESKCQLELEIH